MMELSMEVVAVLQEAIRYAKSESMEYVAPETVMLILSGGSSDKGAGAGNEKAPAPLHLAVRVFLEALNNCGGDSRLLRKELTAYLSDYIERVDGKEDKEPEFSSLLNEMLAVAARSAYSSGSTEVYVRHLLRGLWSLDDCYAVYFLEKQDITEADMLQEMGLSEGTAAGPGMAEDEDDENDDDSGAAAGIAMYAPCLNESLKDVNPLIGREAELERTIQILCRKEKNNPLHIGEPGVGKTALTYGLVQLIKEAKVPDAIKGAKVFSLDLGSLLSGTQYRGDFEKRFKKVLSAISMEEKPIIYIDEIHSLSGAGAVGESSFDASNMLKTYLSEGHIRFIGATTFEEYKKYFEKNKSLVRRFQNVEVKEPGEDEAVGILEGLREKYEDFHGVKYEEGVLEYAVKMSAKYIHERFLPDKAIDLMDEAGAYRKLHPLDNEEQTVDRAVINEILTKICRVPIETVETEDAAKLETLEERLKQKVYGQDEAIKEAVNAVKFSKAGLLEENKPLASLLFAGPTGVGKTEIARQLSIELGVKLIRFDMSEYGEKHATAKLIGAPAGYVGYEEGGLLTEAVRKNPSAVLLLDEIEKAHADIFNVLLQVMDYATLTDNQGRKADFRNIIIIMTSNAGASRIGRMGIGFKSGKEDSGAIMEEVKRLFQPEFRNRLDRIVVFKSMDDSMAALIVDKKLKELSEQLKARKIVLSVDKKLKELVKKRGISAEYGARQLDRVIRGGIKPLFVDEILFGKLKDGGRISLTVSDGEFAIEEVESAEELAVLK